MSRILAALPTTLFACAILVAAPGAAATLRPFGSLAGPTVAVSDLWDDAGAVASVVLGPAPAPGERIVVEAPQLAAIARQFGVAWHAESAAARSILERPGELLAQSKVEAALRAWLTTAGALAGAAYDPAQIAGAIELTGFVAPLVAPDAAAEISVEQCSWMAETGRFTASLAVTGRAMSAIRLHVSGRIVAMAATLVATRRLAPGAVLDTADVRPARIARERLRGVPAASRGQTDGLMLRRALAEGDPVMLADVAPAPVIAKGARVLIAIAAAGVTLSATGEALQAGAMDDAIDVRNPVSHAVLRAVVTGPGTVRVEPGSLPVRPAAAPAESAAP